MKVLVANLGSTSFKYRLFDLAADRQLAAGAIDRIGEAVSACMVETSSGRREMTAAVPDHAEAVRICLGQLTDEEVGCLEAVDEISAIGFKAIFAGPGPGVRLVDEELLQTMEQLADVAPAHNPPYIEAMRQLGAVCGDIPLVAALETGFHESIPPAQGAYGVPAEWYDEYGVRRWGFHGASHRYIGERMAELTGRDDLKLVSCHLGGSSSLCAQRGGVSLANSLGMSPQSGLPHNNRVGDFDPFALPVLMRATGRSLEQLLDDLARRSGLLGLSGGLSGDVRDLEAAAADGHEGARRALDVFVASIRHYLGGYLAALGGAEAIVFTGGIGENSVAIRDAVCRDMQWSGIELDDERNRSASGEMSISPDGARVAVWVVPTNEELIVARQAAELVDGAA